MALFERIRGCALVGGSVSLGVGFKVSKDLARPSFSLFLPVDQVVALSTAPAPCAAMLPATVD